MPSSQHYTLWIIRTITIIIVLGISLFLINNTIVSSMHYDAAYTATVAKNLTLGQGYATSYPIIKKFNPEITSGPTLILPTAILIKFIGNTYWAPTLIASLINFILLLIVLYLPRETKQDPLQHWIFRFILVLFLVCLTISYQWSNLVGDLWFNLVGEISASLLTAIATILLFKTNQTRNVFLAGLILGLGFLTKSIILLSSVSIIVFLIYTYKETQPKRKFQKRVFIIICAFFGGFILSPGTFELYKVLSTSPAEYTQIKKEEQRFFQYEGGSGIGSFNTASSKTNYMKNNIRQNTPIFYNYLGGTNALVLLILITLITLYATPGKTPLHFTSYALLSSFLVNFIWWLTISPLGWIRHLIPGLILLFISLAILTPKIKRKKYIFLLTCLYIAFFTPKLHDFKLLIPRSWQPSHDLSALLKTASFISENKKTYAFKSTDLWGGNCNRDLEYILPGICNFEHINNKIHEQNVALVIDCRYTSANNPLLKNFPQEIIYRKDPFLILNVK